MLAAVISHLFGARGRTARAAAALAIAAATVASLATPALAAPRPLTLDVIVGDFCVSGQAKSNAFVKVVIRDSIGNTKVRTAATVDPYGAWQACVDFIADPIGAGDRISLLVFETGQKLNYTVPLITIDVNRVTDVVSGKAPAGTKLAIEASDSSGPLYGHDPYDITTHVVASNAGTYSHDFGSDGIDLIGGALLDIRSTAAKGAVHVSRQMAVPGLAVMIGQSSFNGYIKPYTHIGITLTGGSSTLATGDAVGDGLYFGQFTGRFVDADGEFYRVQGGEWLSAPALGSDASWQIPTINGTTDLATDKVSGKCFANSPYIVLVGFFGFANGATGASGKFTVDMTSQLNLKKGDDVLIACLTFGGDVVEQEFLAH